MFQKILKFLNVVFSMFPPIVLTVIIVMAGISTVSALNPLTTSFIEFLIVYSFGTIPTAIALAVIWKIVMHEVPIVEIVGGILSVVGVFIGMVINTIFTRMDTQEFRDEQKKQSNKRREEFALYLVPGMIIASFIALLQFMRSVE